MGEGARDAQAPQLTLVRFVLLSMLLHATIVILFGTSHGGGAGRGEGMLDVLDVTLRREPSLPDAGLLAGPGAETAAGRALLPRAEPQPASAAPRRSEPMPAIEPPKTSEPTPIEPATPASGQTQPEAAPPMPPPEVEPLPRIDLRAPQEVDKALIAPVARRQSSAWPRRIRPRYRALDIAPPVIPLPPRRRRTAVAPRSARGSHRRSSSRRPLRRPAPAPVADRALGAPAAPKAVAPPVEVPPSEAPSCRRRSIDSPPRGSTRSWRPRRTWLRQIVRRAAGGARRGSFFAARAGSAAREACASRRRRSQCRRCPGARRAGHAELLDCAWVRRPRRRYLQTEARCRRAAGRIGRPSHRYGGCASTRARSSERNDEHARHPACAAAAAGKADQGKPCAGKGDQARLPHRLCRPGSARGPGAGGEYDRRRRLSLVASALSSQRPAVKRAG